ncbi:MAG: hypothetical protein IJ833_06910 [Lachnospiraceae bacterium]|nr:hypothetical protein [Lachnospiraceae bacterium]
MKTEIEIKENFHRTLQCAEELKRVADQMQGFIARELPDAADISKGDGTEACKPRKLPINQELLQTVEQLSDVADHLKTISLQVYDAEMKNLKFAQAKK